MTAAPEKIGNETWTAKNTADGVAATLDPDAQADRRNGSKTPRNRASKTIVASGDFQPLGFAARQLVERVAASRMAFLEAGGDIEAALRVRAILTDYRGSDNAA